MLINWRDVNIRYPETLKIADATQADSSWVPYAIRELEARLSTAFTTPFSDNNMTAKDLTIDLAFAKVYRYKDNEKAAAVSSYVASQIADLIHGKMSMITDTGEVIQGSIGTMYSTTEKYHSVFGMSPVEYSVVSSQEIWDEESARGRP